MIEGLENFAEHFKEHSDKYICNYSPANLER